MPQTPRSRLLLMALVSLVTICFQLLLTKVLALVFWNHVVYLVISIALLGYGASSTLIAVQHERLSKTSPRLFLGTNLFFFALSALFALFCLRFLELDPNNVLVLGQLDFLGAAFGLLSAYLLFLLPFFFAGNVIVFLFFAHPDDANRLYFYDLLGAAAGCLAFVPLLAGTGALGGILICCFVLLPWAIADAWAELPTRWAQALLAASVALGLATLFAYPAHDRVFPLKVDPQKVLGTALEASPDNFIEYSAWDVVTRVDVVGTRGTAIDVGWTQIDPKNKLVTFDGDAVSHIPSRAPDFPTEADVAAFERSSFYMPLLGNTRGGDHVIIGLGGAPDISTLLLMRARSITAVEINGALIKALKTRFADFGGNVVHRDNVRLVHSEGRSFLHREPRAYDLIFMSGTDTFTALNTGAYVLAENFLYTKEALHDYYSRLSENGSIFILRWFFDGYPRESLRLFATALEALREQGVEHPEHHVLVSRAIWTRGFSPGLTVIRKRALAEPEAAETLKAIVEHPGLKPIYVPHHAPTADFIPEARFYTELQQAFLVGREDGFYDTYRYDVEPVDDDRPFFFNYYRLSTILREGLDVTAATGPIHGYWAYLVFLLILASATAAVGLFIWLPLWKFKREGLRGEGKLSATLYFAALGMGFIMLEITLMQKFALFLGHPMYSITTILSGMLLFAGLGSKFSARWRERPTRGITLALAWLAGTIVLFLLVVEPLLRLGLGASLALRITMAVAMIGPLAFLLGFFFPLGLLLVERRQPSYVPWAWGINSGFTVIGSIVSIMIAMAIGFTAVIKIVIVVYAFGVFGILRYARLGPTPAPADK